MAAIKLREQGDIEKASSIFIQLANDYPNDPQVNYHCAWTYDVMGLDKGAIPYYEKAIHLGLPKSDLKEAYLGLGSTYRAVGEYLKSEELLETAIKI